MINKKLSVIILGNMSFDFPMPCKNNSKIIGETYK